MASVFPRILFAFGMAVSLASPSMAEGDMGLTEYEFVIPGYLHEQYVEYTSDFNPLDMGPVKEEGLWRHLAEAAIFEVAAVIGGCECRITYRNGTAATSFARNLAEIKNGRSLSYPIAAFEDLIEKDADNVMLTEPVLGADEFFVGFYTNSDRDDVLSLTDPQEILALDYSVARGWDVDIAVLESRGLNTIVADDWYALIRMIKNGRSDVVLQPFSGEDDFSQLDDVSGEILMPIPGFKMAFPHARSYVVSASHPDGEAFLEALNAGLAEMRETGLLEEYMIKAGVINPRISSFDEV